MLLPVSFQAQSVSKGSVITKGTAVVRASIPSCPEAMYSIYLTMGIPAGSCWQNTSVLQWTGYTCTDDAGEFCPGLGTNGSNLAMTLDHGGCLPLYSCPNTIFVGRGSLPGWASSATALSGSQWLDIVLSGSVYGATKFNPWPHYKRNGNNSIVGITCNGAPSASNCGSVEWKFTVACGAGCGSGGQGAANGSLSDMVCNYSTIGGPECNEQSSEGPYASYNLFFSTAPASSPYAITAEMIVRANGNGGTAWTEDNGMHWIH
jgi:hypothetical protein